jgi:hypothetical protein
MSTRSLEKIAAGDFFETLHRSRRQIAWFLPPTLARSCARAGDFFEILHGRPAAKSVVFAACLGA